MTPRRPTSTNGLTRRWPWPAAVVVVAATALGVAGCGAAATGGTAAKGLAAPQPTTTVAALEVASTTPVTGAASVAFNAPITVSFSAPLAAGAADPTLTPAVAGAWAQSGSSFTFTPSDGYAPYAHETVTVPSGLRNQAGGVLAAPVTASFSTGAPSMLRLQQLLAGLGYLPLTFTAAASPTGATPAAPTSAAPTPAATTTASPAGAVSGADATGTFAWAFPGTPAGLQAQWVQGQANGITRGAVMAFEADHGLAVDGSAGPQVWAALVVAVGAHQVDPRPYDYISVTQTRPETLTVWQAGTVVYTTLANTGVPGAITATGTYPVYERFTTTTMRGTNPDGSKYVDPGIPWVAYFNGGDAIHGFDRAGYGYPQSDGCVELPPTHAQAVYPMDYYGTLVTVS